MSSYMPLLIKGHKRGSLQEIRLIGQVTFISRIMGSLIGWSGEIRPIVMPMIICS